MADHALASFVVIPIGTSNPANTVTPGSVIDLWSLSGLSSKPDGATLYLKITNGATGPGVAGEIVILESLTIGNTPPAVPSTPNADWKQVFAIGGGIVANEVTPSRYTVGPNVRYVTALIRSNTVQPVVGEVLGTAFAY